MISSYKRPYMMPRRTTIVLGSCDPMMLAMQALGTQAMSADALPVLGADLGHIWVMLALFRMCKLVESHSNFALSN